MKKTRTNPRNDRPEPLPRSECFCGGFGPRFTALTAGMCQGPLFDHFRAAGVETLKGFRALLDAQIESLNRGSRRGTKVPVE